MSEHVILLSIPGLREKDVAGMCNLRNLTAGGQIADLVPSFPCVTCPVQANMTTGRLPREHGVVANGSYHRDARRVEMWTAPNGCITSPQIWDRMAESRPELTSAVWFPLHSKECGANYVCTPAPIHHLDGAESLWCYTRPDELYGTLLDELGHFPLKHFWGPMANVKSSEWIVDSAIHAAKSWQPNFFYIYLPHLDYAAQRSGPDSDPACQAVDELDQLLGRMAEAFGEAYGDDPLWIVAGEYAITPVEHVSYPNRILREMGLAVVRDEEDGEHLDLEASRAFAMVDHQFSHVFTDDTETARRVADRFRGEPGIADVLVGEQLAPYGLDHSASGQVVLVSTPDSWQAYYWWLSDDRAPGFARTVDIHRKPGYDPVELHFDPATRSIPLDASLVKGSHGIPAVDAQQRTVIVTSEPGLFSGVSMADVDLFRVVTDRLGIEGE